MHSFVHKIIGSIIVVLSAVILVILNYFPQLDIIQKFGPEKEFEVFMLAAFFGLFIMCFSKEKVDDERVKQIRAKALQIAFGMMCIVLISFQFAILVINGTADSTEVLPVITAVGLLSYLFFFHVGLYFDADWVYNDDTVSANFRKNKRFFIFYTIFMLISIVLISL